MSDNPNIKKTPIKTETHEGDLYELDGLTIKHYFGRGVWVDFPLPNTKAEYDRCVALILYNLKSEGVALNEQNIIFKSTDNPALRKRAETKYEQKRLDELLTRFLHAYATSASVVIVRESGAAEIAWSIWEDIPNT
jgi:hypothetical protein